MTPTYLLSIHHDGSKRYVKSTSADLHLGDEIIIRLRSATDAPIERILLRTCPDGEQFFAEMKIEETSSACTWWQAKLHLNMPLTSYRFLLFTSDGIWWYNGSGPHQHVPTDAEDFRLLADYSAPHGYLTASFIKFSPTALQMATPQVMSAMENLNIWESSPVRGSGVKNKAAGPRQWLNITAATCPA